MVFPLELKSEDPSLLWVGEGVALSLAAGLRSAGMTALTYDERVRLVEGEDLPTGMPLSRASMIRVAQQASADFLVYGSCSGAAASLQLSAIQCREGDHVTGSPRARRAHGATRPYFVLAAVAEGRYEGRQNYPPGSGTCS